jgi:DNA-binding GntR family transcriptional regulator
MEYDRLFHARISEIAGNLLLADFLRPIHERLFRIWFFLHWQFQDFNLTEGEYELLYAALKNRDAKAAGLATAEHIESLIRLPAD